MTRIEKEQRIATLMIKLYCRHKEGNKTLCPQCSTLAEYARSRLTRCRFGEAKPPCSRCPVHCYNPTMRRQIKEVMRYAGPRMLFYAPVEAIRHMLASTNILKYKKALTNSGRLIR